MNDEQRLQIVAQARAYWDEGFPRRTGMVIFECIPLDDRPLWAADLLEAVYSHIPPIPQVTAVLEFATKPELWPHSRRHEAHGIFDAVRDINLTSDESAHYQILDLAEDAAGITYTARQYPAPFDHARGWRIVELLYHLIKTLALDETDAWQIVANKRYILLDAPIRCNPGCPTCMFPGWDKQLLQSGFV
jgi:hypothetical protein